MRARGEWIARQEGHRDDDDRGGGDDGDDGDGVGPRDAPGKEDAPDNVDVYVVGDIPIPTPPWGAPRVPCTTWSRGRERTIGGQRSASRRPRETEDGR